MRAIACASVLVAAALSLGAAALATERALPSMDDWDLVALGDQSFATKFPPPTQQYPIEANARGVDGQRLTFTVTCDPDALAKLLPAGTVPATNAAGRATLTVAFRFGTRLQFEPYASLTREIFGPMGGFLVVASARTNGRAEAAILHQLNPSASAIVRQNAMGLFAVEGAVHTKIEDKADGTRWYKVDVTSASGTPIIAATARAPFDPAQLTRAQPVQQWLRPVGYDDEPTSGTVFLAYGQSDSVRYNVGGPVSLDIDLPGNVLHLPGGDLVVDDVRAVTSFAFVDYQFTMYRFPSP